MRKQTPGDGEVLTCHSEIQGHPNSCLAAKVQGDFGRRHPNNEIEHPSHVFTANAPLLGGWRAEWADHGRASEFSSKKLLKKCRAISDLHVKTRL